MPPANIIGSMHFFDFQKNYWNKLSADAKIMIMEILFSILEFSATYNSYTNLRLRMQQIPTERLAKTSTRLGNLEFGMLLHGYSPMKWVFEMWKPSPRQASIKSSPPRVSCNLHLSGYPAKDNSSSRSWRRTSGQRREAWRHSWRKAGLFLQTGAKRSIRFST